MKIRHALIAIGIGLLGAGGVALATHTQTTEEIVYDPPPITTSVVVDPPPVTLQDTDQLPHETVTVTVTTPTGTTPTGTTPTTTEPDPGDPIVCTTANREVWGPTYEPGECVVGTTIVRNVSGSTSEEAGQFRCSQALSNYGPLPILVRFNFTGNPDWGDRGHIDLIAGCVGPANSGAIDLIVESNADPNLNLGSCGGGGKFRAPPGPNNIQVTGNFNGGAQCGAAHQDGLQFQGTGANMDVVNGVIGDYDAGIAGNAGSGGAFIYSTNSDVDILGGEYVTCNHAISATGEIDVVDAKFRAGRVDGSDPYCARFFAGATCPPATARMVNVTCQRWNGTTWVDQAGY